MNGPLVDSLPNRRRETDPEFVLNRRSEIELYRQDLAGLPYGELLKQFEIADSREQQILREKLELEEQQRPFNRPAAVADLEHWSKKAYWTIEEAVALSFGRSPEIVNWETVEGYVAVSSFAADYAKLRDLVFRAVRARQLHQDVLPGFYLAWALRNNIELPAELIRSVESRGVSIGDWKDAYFKLSASYEEFRMRNVDLTEKLQLVQTQCEEYRQRLTDLKAVSWDGFDPQAPDFPVELDIAMTAWIGTSRNRDSSMTVKQQLLDLIIPRAEQHGLGQAAVDRIARVCNWAKDGGRPRQYGRKG